MRSYSFASYRESRFKRYRQLDHKVSAQSTTTAGTPMPEASASLPNARAYHCRFLRVRLDLCLAVLSSDSVLVVTMVAENNGADSNSGDKPSYHIIDAPQVTLYRTLNTFFLSRSLYFFVTDVLAVR